MRLALPIPVTLRRLARRPAFLALAVATLGLGIGAAASTFAIVDVVLLRPLPYPQPERLVSIWSHAALPARAGGSPASINEAVEYGDRSRSFAALAAVGWHPATLLGGDQPRQVTAAVVTQPFFRVMGVQPALGRGFVVAEDAPGANDTLVLSDGLWRQGFGADRRVLRRNVVLDGRPRLVVGVMPPGFDYPGHADLWLPMAIDRAALDAHTIESHGLQVVARLRPRTSPEAAARDLDRVVRELAAVYPGHFPPHEGVKVETLEQTLLGRSRTPLLSLLVAVGLLLLLACVNVANLLLLRAQERRREMAVRDALGASPWGLLGQLLAEALWLSLLAALFGLVAARLSLAGVRALLPTDLPRAAALAIDWRVLAFVVAVAMAATLLVSVAPAWGLRQGRGAIALRGGARAPRSGRLPDTLVVGQVALALVLSTGAGLAGRSLGELARVDVGFAPRGALTGRISLPDSSAYRSATQVEGFFAALADRLASDRRVTAVGAASWLPFVDFPSDWPVEVEGYTPGPGESTGGVEYTLTAGDYLQAMGARLIAGRTLRAGDEVGLRKAVVTEKFVQRFFAGREPLGRQIRLQGDPTPYEIVGVVADQPLRGPAAPARAGLFLPLAEISTGHPWLPRDLAVVVRTIGPPVLVTATLRRVVHELDPQVPLAEVRTFDEIWRQALGEPRSLFGLLVLFAAAGLLIGGVGTFAVAAAWVARGRRDIGIRMALGAERRRVIHEVLGRGFRLTVVGCVLGSVVAVMAARAVRARLLFQVAPSDPRALGAAALLLLVVGLLATLAPARRAAAVEPMRVLREE